MLLLYVLATAILVLYLTRALKYSDNTAVAIYHAFSAVSYFTPLFGAMLADGWLGKYRSEKFSFRPRSFIVMGCYSCLCTVEIILAIRPLYLSRNVDNVTV